MRPTLGSSACPRSCGHSAPFHDRPCAQTNSGNRSPDRGNRRKPPQFQCRAVSTIFAWVSPSAVLLPLLFPTEHFEYFFLNRRHFFFRQSWVHHLMLCLGTCATQAKKFLPADSPHFLEFETLAPHQQQCDDVAEIDPAGIGLSFEPLE